MQTQRTALAVATFLPTAALALTDTGAPAWIGIVAALFIGTMFGIFIMGLLNMNGKSVDDAIWHLGRLYLVTVKMQGISRYPKGGAIDNARRFLLRWGEGEEV